MSGYMLIGYFYFVDLHLSQVGLEPNLPMQFYQRILIGPTSILQHFNNLKHPAIIIKKYFRHRA